MLISLGILWTLNQTRFVISRFTRISLISVCENRRYILRVEFGSYFNKLFAFIECITRSNLTEQQQPNSMKCIRMVIFSVYWLSSSSASCTTTTTQCCLVYSKFSFVWKQLRFVDCWMSASSSSSWSYQHQPIHTRYNLLTHIRTLSSDINIYITHYVHARYDDQPLLYKQTPFFTCRILSCERQTFTVRLIVFICTQRMCISCFCLLRPILSVYTPFVHLIARRVRR